MEVAKIGANGIRIKSKLATLGVNPFGGKTKILMDGVLLFSKDITTPLDVEGESTIINGPGEYEIKGIKLNGIGKTTVIGYAGKIDGIDVCITTASTLNTTKEGFGEYDMVIVDEDVLLEQSVLAKLNPTVAVLYGQKAEEHVKALGKEITPVAKYVVTKDKLPAELEVVLLQ